MRIVIGPNGQGLEKIIPTIKSCHPEVDIVHCDDRSRLSDELATAEAYMGWLSREAFVGAKNLKWLQSPSTGVDGFLRIPELRDGDVILTSARGTHAACLAEHALGMIFAFTRGIRASIMDQQDHTWGSRKLRNSLVELTGSTVGIVGFGSVGRALAERVHAFGTRILAVDVVPDNKPDYVETLEGVGGLPDLLAASDYVVVTVPLTASTRHLISAEQIGLMKPSAMLIGISRGSVIDEDALVAALEEDRLAAAALDVFETEPLPADSPLWDVKNLLITPHDAGGTQFEADHILEIFAENVDRYVERRFPLRNQIDKQQGF